MSELGTYAAFAEIFGAIAILSGAIFAIVQLSEFRRRRRYQVATDLCRGFTEPDLARAVTLLRSLPDGISLTEIRDLEPQYEEAAQIVGMTFETMGLMVHRDIASFKIVQELAGGLLLMMWRKTGQWIKDTRVEDDNPRFGEWCQWLAERISDKEETMTPAHIAHKDWLPGKFND